MHKCYHVSSSYVQIELRSCGPQQTALSSSHCVFAVQYFCSFWRQYFIFIDAYSRTEVVPAIIAVVSLQSSEARFSHVSQVSEHSSNVLAASLTQMFKSDTYIFEEQSLALVTPAL